MSCTNGIPQGRRRNVQKAYINESSNEDAKTTPAPIPDCSRPCGNCTYISPEPNESLQNSSINNVPSAANRLRSNNNCTYNSPESNGSSYSATYSNAPPGIPTQSNRRYKQRVYVDPS